MPMLLHRHWHVHTHVADPSDNHTYGLTGVVLRTNLWGGGGSLRVMLPNSFPGVGGCQSRIISKNVDMKETM